ncbi:Alpha/Beta hydrolase protein [Ilyonectria robusta]|uniref:Alpha/Beta hydrolase protein n=1 Tax=Ilyonectria robusta TaxID=1079257 RepID=UPI001E8D6287|nr:Alpha/Beta hydrolase protein [Ilyonectria robusta]KAH8675161.1 Alpha/Beta hydrolase protein [Ilyonectria robusta]
MRLETTILNHPILGDVQGSLGNGVFQFLGIKYASLENRFSEPQDVEHSGQAPIVATRHGPPVIMAPGSVDMEMSFIQQSLPKFDVPPMSDTDGLNLNITVPQHYVDKMPVLVFIHGGGFNFGSSSYPQYDQTRIVQQSIGLRKPIVAVNFNYRLGIPGFLTSKDLLDAGYKSNRGLRDQRAALKWIKRHISGFGGDPNRITVIGQSAGAASINFHMQSQEPLFDQAILLGGSFLLVKPQTPESAESVYQSTIRSLSIEASSCKDRVQSLLNIPAEKLVDAALNGKTPPGPVIDDDLIPAIATFENIKEFPMPGKNWCERLFCLGNQFDGSLFAIIDLGARLNGITEAFRLFLIDGLGDTAACKILDHYGILQGGADEESIINITQLLTDVGYYAPLVKAGEAYPAPFILGHFNERNPWAGIHQGRANHILDIAYLWGNYEDKYGPQNKVIAEALAEDVISFIWGQDVLPSFNDGKRVVVYGPAGDDVARQVLDWRDKKTGRNVSIFELAELAGGLDKLLDVLIAFCWGKESS